MTRRTLADRLKALETGPAPGATIRPSEVPNLSDAELVAIVADGMPPEDRAAVAALVRGDPAMSNADRQHAEAILTTMANLPGQ